MAWRSRKHTTRVVQQSIVERFLSTLQSAESASQIEPQIKKLTQEVLTGLSGTSGQKPSGTSKADERDLEQWLTALNLPRMDIASDQDLETIVYFETNEMKTWTRLLAADKIKAKALKEKAFLYIANNPAFHGWVRLSAVGNLLDPSEAEIRSRLFVQLAHAPDDEIAIGIRCQIPYKFQINDIDALIEMCRSHDKEVAISAVNRTLSLLHDNPGSLERAIELVQPK